MRRFQKPALEMLTLSPFSSSVSEMLNSTDLRPTTGAVSPEYATVQSFIVVKYSIFLQQPGLAKHISLFTKHFDSLK